MSISRSLPALFAALIMSFVFTSVSHAATATISDAQSSGPGNLQIAGTGLTTATTLQANLSSSSVKYYRPGTNGASNNPGDANFVWSADDISIFSDTRLAGEYVRSVSVYASGNVTKTVNTYISPIFDAATSPGNGVVQITGNGLAKAPYYYLVFDDGTFIRVANKTSAGGNPKSMTVTMTSSVVTITDARLEGKTVTAVKVSSSSSGHAQSYGELSGLSLAVLPVSSATGAQLFSVTSPSGERVVVTGEGFNDINELVLEAQPYSQNITVHNPTVPGYSFEDDWSINYQDVVSWSDTQIVIDYYDTPGIVLEHARATDMEYNEISGMTTSFTPVEVKEKASSCETSSLPNMKYITKLRNATGQEINLGDTQTCTERNLFTMENNESVEYILSDDRTKYVLLKRDVYTGVVLDLEIGNTNGTNVTHTPLTHTSTYNDGVNTHLLKNWDRPVLSPDNTKLMMRLTSSGGMPQIAASGQYSYTAGTVYVFDANTDNVVRGMTEWLRSDNNAQMTQDSPDYSEWIGEVVQHMNFNSNNEIVYATATCQFSIQEGWRDREYQSSCSNASVAKATDPNISGTILGEYLPGNDQMASFTGISGDYLYYTVYGENDIQYPGGEEKVKRTSLLTGALETVRTGFGQMFDRGYTVNPQGTRMIIPQESSGPANKHPLDLVSVDLTNPSSQPVDITGETRGCSNNNFPLLGDGGYDMEAHWSLDGRYLISSCVTGQRAEGAVIDTQVHSAPYLFTHTKAFSNQWGYYIFPSDGYSYQAK